MKIFFLLACVVFLPFFGCSERHAEPIALNQMGAEFEKVFKGAREDTRSLTAAIARLVERKQYAPASMQLQTILSDPTLNKDQRSVVARALMSINTAMQAQLEVQEAAVAAPPSASVPRRPSAQGIPDFSSGNTESSAAEAKMILENHRRTK